MRVQDCTYFWVEFCAACCAQCENVPIEPDSTSPCPPQRRELPSALHSNTAKQKSQLVPFQLHGATNIWSFQSKNSRNFRGSDRSRHQFLRQREHPSSSFCRQSVWALKRRQVTFCPQHNSLKAMCDAKMLHFSDRLTTMLTGSLTLLQTSQGKWFAWQIWELTSVTGDDITDSPQGFFSLLTNFDSDRVLKKKTWHKRLLRLLYISLENINSRHCFLHQVFLMQSHTIEFQPENQICRSRKNWFSFSLSLQTIYCRKTTQPCLEIYDARKGHCDSVNLFSLLDIRDLFSSKWLQIMIVNW